MIEGLLMLSMLSFVYLLLLQARRLTDPKAKKKTLLAIFDFKVSIDRTTNQTPTQVKRK